MGKKKRESLTYLLAVNRIEDCVTALHAANEALDPEGLEWEANMKCIMAFNAEWNKILAEKLRRSNKLYKVTSDELKASADALKLAKQSVKDLANSINNSARALNFLQKLIGMVSK